jgi:hypothetical protein
MEAWHIANDYLRRYSWSLSPPKPSRKKAAAAGTNNGDDDDDWEDVEREELSPTSSSFDDYYYDDDKERQQQQHEPLIWTLRHSHNPTTSPSRVLFGTILLAGIVLTVLKLLQIGWHDGAAPLS